MNNNAVMTLDSDKKDLYYGHLQAISELCAELRNSIDELEARVDLLENLEEGTVISVRDCTDEYRKQVERFIV